MPYTSEIKIEENPLSVHILTKSVFSLKKKKKKKKKEKKRKERSIHLEPRERDKRRFQRYFRKRRARAGGFRRNVTFLEDGVSRSDDTASLW